MHTKYTSYFFLLFILSVFSSLCLGQSQVQIQTEIEIIQTTKKNSSDGKINVKVSNGSAPYKIYLSKTPALRKEEDIISSKNINLETESVSFENLNSGVYYILSVDLNKNYSINKVTIEQQIKQ